MKLVWALSAAYFIASLVHFVHNVILALGIRVPGLLVLAAYGALGLDSGLALAMASVVLISRRNLPVRHA